MANKKFSELVASDDIDNINNLLCISQDMGMATFESRKITLQDLINAIGTGMSGTYTPTATIITNVDVATPTKAQWSRVGNIVTVSGAIGIDQTANGVFQVDISLPIASDIAVPQDINGVINTNTNMGTSFAGGFVQGDPTNDRAAIRGISALVVVASWKYVFQYEII